MQTTVTSTELLESLRQPGNESAWRRFCARYESMLLAFARAGGLREADACDVVQDTLLVFVERFRAGEYDRAQGRLRTWLKGIMFNKLREARRRNARAERQVVADSNTTAFLDRVPDAQESWEEVFEREWQQAILADCLRAVREHVDAKTFEAFRLYALEDWPPARVAAHLDMDRGMVYVSKSRVMAHLRKLHECLVETW
jgi:RNA polymerase sigma-70 factor, ECF subfamily